MDRPGLAQTIRDGYFHARVEADRELARLALQDVTLVNLSADDVVAIQRHQTELGPVWLALVRAYRGGSRGALGPVLLEMLAPWLVAASIRLNPVPPVVTEEDIRQNLVLEALRALAVGTLPRDPQWLPRHVTLRATQATARYLAQEQRRQRLQVPLDEDSAELVEGPAKAAARIPGAQNVRPQTQNVRRRERRKGTTRVHMGSRASRTSALGWRRLERKS